MIVLLFGLTLSSSPVALRAFQSQLLLRDNITISLSHCLFSDILSSLGFGGAFFAVSRDHSLNVSDTYFIRCQSLNCGNVGFSLSRIGGGAFVFSGGHSLTVRSSFVRCSAVSNSQTAHSWVYGKGLNKIDHCYFFRNGGCKIDSHSLFGLDHGNVKLNSANASHNLVKGGYAAGHIGWFCRSAALKFCSFERNVGKSIFGSSTGNPELFETEAQFFMVFGNIATKYGIYRTHSGLLTLNNAVFIGNKGRVFYGQAPITLTDCVFDCEKPNGTITCHKVTWSFVGEKQLDLEIPKQIPKELADGVCESAAGDVEDVFDNVDRCARDPEPPELGFLGRLRRRIRVFFMVEDPDDPEKLMAAKKEDWFWSWLFDWKWY
jgi:hypothetical protein